MAAPARGAPAEKPEEGIPVTDPLVIHDAGPVTQKDDKGNLSRISWERTTPEGWEEAIKRMVRLNGATSRRPKPGPILKYLQHLSRPGSRRSQARDVHARTPYSGRAHSERNVSHHLHGMPCPGQGASWRRSKEDWKLLTNMHVAFFPQADVAFRRRMVSGRRGRAGRRARRSGGSLRATDAASGAGAGPAGTMRLSTFWQKPTRCTLPSGPPGEPACARPGWPAAGWSQPDFPAKASITAR